MDKALIEHLLCAGLQREAGGPAPATALSAIYLGKPQLKNNNEFEQ